MISILLTAITENFQQPLTTPAINGNVTKKLMALTALSAEIKRVNEIILQF